MNDNVSVPWDRLRSLTSSRRTYLFGDGQVAIKTLRGLGTNVAGIVDNFPNYWGSVGIAGLEISAPSSVLAWSADTEAKPCFVITSTAVRDIGAQLERAGFRAGEDYWVAPPLHDLTLIARMEALRFDALVASGSAAPQEGLQGGGIYRVSHGDPYPDVSCVFQGETHGLVPFQGGYLATTAEHGLTWLSPSLEVVRTQENRGPGRLHGVVVDEQRGLILSVNSDSDRVLGFDEELRPRLEMPVCPCSDYHAPGIHHANDVDVLDGVVLVSMFSASGMYRSQVYDGAVGAIREKGGRFDVSFLTTGLTMPHNVRRRGGSVVVLDSFHGRVLRENFELVAQLPGFARGLAWISDFWIVGQSKNRNFSLLRRDPPGASVDSGIAVLDPRSGAFRTVPLPRSISEIHSVVPLSLSE